MRRIEQVLRFITAAGIILSSIGGFIIYSGLGSVREQVECWLVPKPGQTVEFPGILKSYDDAFSMLDDWTFAAICNSNIVSASKNAADVEVMHIGDKYAEIADVTLLKGRFIWKEDIDSSRHVMVIDRELAFELFGHLECVGLEVKYRDEKFKIIGVCSRESLVKRKAAYRALVPGSIEVSPEYIGIIGDVKHERGGISGAALKNSISASVSGYYVDLFNLQEKKLMLRQKLFINFKLICLIIIALFLRLAYVRLKQVVCCWRARLESSYLSGFARDCWKELLCEAVIIIAVITFSILLWKLSAYRVVIPSGLIPDDLSNPSQYMENISNFILEANRGVRYIPSSMLYVNFCNRIAEIFMTTFWLCLLSRVGLSKWSGFFISKFTINS